MKLPIYESSKLTRVQFQLMSTSQATCRMLWVLLILDGSSNDIDEVILKASSFICFEIISEKG